MSDVSVPGEEDMKSYIVRIYHSDGKDPKRMAGVVEEIGREGKRGFLGPESLWKILSTPPLESLPEKKGIPKGKNWKDERKDTLTFNDILKKINNDDE